MDSLTEDELLSALPPELPPLVFILGAHRSGTTFLHQVLADTGQYSFVSPYDLICFEQLLTIEAQGASAARRAELDGELRAGQSDRGLDELAIGAEVAEEYGHLLPKAGRFSLFTPTLTTETRPRFELLCRKKMAQDGQSVRPLILKNPDDFYTNFAQLHAWYPQARMVFLHRHPLPVLNSQIKAWTRLLETPNHYFARLNAPYRRMLERPKELRFRLEMLRSRTGAFHELEQLAGGYKHYLDQVTDLPPGIWISLRYEDLCADPDHHLRQVSDFLGQPAPAESLRERINTRPVSLLPQVEAAYETGWQALSAYLDAFEYDRKPEF